MSYQPDADAATKPASIAFLFHVEIDGRHLGDFVAVEGLSYKVEPYVYKEGGRNTSPHTLVSNAAYGQLTLRWGMMERDALWEWSRAARVGNSFRREARIYQLTRGGEVLRTYTVQGAWPVGWEGATLDARDSALPVESLTLAFDDLTVEVFGDAG